MTETQLVVPITHHTRIVGTSVAVQTQMVPLVVTNTIVDSMDDATFIIVIHNVSPPLGGTTILTTNLFGQDHIIGTSMMWWTLSWKMSLEREVLIGMFHKKVCIDQHQGTWQQTMGKTWSYFKLKWRPQLPEFSSQWRLSPWLLNNLPCQVTYLLSQWHALWSFVFCVL